MITYGDTVLYADDIKSLKNPEYLTDSVISLFFELLTSECLEAILLSPSIVQLIKFSDIASITAMFSVLELDKYKVILCPVNDSASRTSAISGEHWSLLCIVKDDNVAYSIDSANNFNVSECQEIVPKLSVLLKPDNKTEKFAFENLACTQQENGYDCGVHVIYFARQIIRNFSANGKFDGRVVRRCLPFNYRTALYSELIALPLG